MLQSSHFHAAECASIEATQSSQNICEHSKKITFVKELSSLRIGHTDHVVGTLGGAGGRWICIGGAAGCCVGGRWICIGGAAGCCVGGRWISIRGAAGCCETGRFNTNG